MRQNLAKAMGLFISGTTTSAGAANGTTLVDSGLARYDDSNPGLTQKWLLITSGTNDGESRIITTSSGGTQTVTTAFTNQVAQGVTYEILPWDPDLYLDSTVQAIRNSYPDLYLPLRDETLIVDNLLTNSSFETGTFTGWTQTAGTWTANTDRFVHGSQSATVTASGAAAQLTQNIFNSINAHEAASKTLHVRGWALTTTASAARLRVTFDGSTFSNGSFHAGDAEWEGPSLQQIDVAFDGDATECTVYCEVADGSTGSFDLVTAWLDPIHRYTIPTDFIDGPHKLFQQADRHRPDGLYLPLGPDHRPRSGLILRLEGQGRLTEPTTDASTVEVDEERSELLVAKAAQYLYRTLANRASGGDRERHLQDMTLWEQRYELLKPKHRMVKMSAHERKVWGVTEDSGGRFLTLKVR